eukprot:scaffold72128_cov57-Phaeocystis_antarctica.AAC.1
MNSYSAPSAPPKLDKDARGAPDPPQPFPVPFRPPASACGARFFSFFTANTMQKTNQRQANLARMYPGDGTLKSGDQKCAMTSTWIERLFEPLLVLLNHHIQHLRDHRLAQQNGQQNGQNWSMKIPPGAAPPGAVSSCAVSPGAVPP